MLYKSETNKTVKSGIVMLSIALALRQMSMSMVAPFISTYCKTLAGYTPLLAGFALGIFGLTQAIFQIPYGMMSDRYGNKPIMVTGLLQTVAGLIIAFFAKNIGLLVFARALQGSGAVIGIGYSWASGLAGEHMRTKAIGTLSAFVSLGAAIAFIIGPVLREFMQVNQMFLLCAAAIFITVIYIILSVKDPKKSSSDIRFSISDIKLFFKNKKFASFSFLAFLNNFMMMSVFYAVPIYLSSMLGESSLWKVFVPAIPISFIAMKAAVSFTDKGFENPVLITAFLLSSASILFFFNKASLAFLVTGIILFFCGYISLASVIAAGVNTVSDDKRRGTVNGIFNSMQFLGNFAGPAVTGLIWGISQKASFSVILCAGIAGIVIAVKSSKS